MKRDRLAEVERLLYETESSFRAMLIAALPEVVATGSALFVNSEFVPPGLPKREVLGKGEAFYRNARSCLELRQTLGLPTADTVGALFLEACAENASEREDRLGPRRLAAALMERLERAV